MKLILRIVILTTLAHTTLQATTPYTVAWYDKHLPARHHTTTITLPFDNISSWDDLFTLLVEKAQIEKKSLPTACSKKITVTQEASKILIRPLCRASEKKFSIVYGFEKPSLRHNELLHTILQAPHDYQITFVTLKPKLFKREKFEYEARKKGLRGMFTFRCPQE